MNREFAVLVRFDVLERENSYVDVGIGGYL